MRSNVRHAALASELAGEIAAGTYPVGSRFPSEQDLQSRFGLGRHTIREALKVLAEQGLLGRRRRTGTVVLSREPVAPYVHSLRDVQGLFDFARSTVLDVRHQGVVSGVGGFLTAEQGDRRWFRIAGLRSTRADGRPLCWSEILVPEAFKPDREAVRRGDRAIYRIIQETHGLKLDYVEQEILASVLPGKLAGLLGAEADAAALLVRRTYFAHGHGVFEISQNLYPSGRYSVKSIIRQRA